MCVGVCGFMCVFDTYLSNTINNLHYSLVFNTHTDTLICFVIMWTIFQAAQALFDGVPMETIRTMVPELRDKSPDQLQDK